MSIFGQDSIAGGSKTLPPHGRFTYLAQRWVLKYNAPVGNWRLPSNRHLSKVIELETDDAPP